MCMDGGIGRVDLHVQCVAYVHVRVSKKRKEERRRELRNGGRKDVISGVIVTRGRDACSPAFVCSSTQYY